MQGVVGQDVEVLLADVEVIAVFGQDRRGGHAVDDELPDRNRRCRRPDRNPLVTGRADGTGLGLAVAQDLVSRHDGLIEFESRPGLTTFTILLPFHAADTGEAS